MAASASLRNGGTRAGRQDVQRRLQAGHYEPAACPTIEGLSGPSHPCAIREAVMVGDAVAAVRQTLGRRHQLAVQR